MAGLLIGFAGVLCVLGVWRGVAGATVPALACLGSTASYGATFAYMQRFFAGRSGSAAALSAAQLVCASVELAVVAPALAGLPHWPGVPAAVALLALGALGTGLAYVLNLGVVRAAGPTVASTVTYVIPVWSTAIGAVLLAEPVGWNTVVGGVVVVAGVVVTRFPDRVRVVALPGPRRGHAPVSLRRALPGARGPGCHSACVKLSGLLHRTRSELPGVSGVARVDRHTGALLRRLRPGDVAVLDQVDLDRATADALVAAAVVAVVNAAPSISGRFPNLGPQILVDAGIPLVDAVGAEVLHAVKDGIRVRVHEGVLYAGEQVLAEGVAQTADSVADALVEAKSGLAHQLEAFAANTIEFMRRERGMLLDGVGVPDVQVDLADRQVLVVAAGYDHVADLARLRRFIREYRPRLIGVGAGADALLAAGHRPDLIVGNPAEVSEEALTCGADVVVPAFTDGHAPGLHRVQDLGAGAVTFLSSANPEDLALLLAHHHGASMIITVGLSATMGEFLDRGRSGSNASTFLTRLQTGGTVVDARVVAALYRNRISGWLVALLLVAAASAVVAALLVSAAGDGVLAWVQQGATAAVELVRGGVR